MHICQIVASWDNGGLEKHVIELSNALSLIHKVTVIVHPVIQHSFESTVNVVVIDFDQPRWSPRLYWQLLQVFNALKPDIIHTQANKAALLVARLRPWLKFKAGYIATLHNQKDSTAMYESFDRVIVVSSRLVPLVKHAPVTVIHNGIITPEPIAGGRAYLVDHFGLDATKPIWMAVGRLVEAKGFDFLIEAIKHKDLQVVIIGDGPLNKELANQAKNSQANVTFAGYFENSQRLLAVADALVISSRNEGGPYTLVEALLARVPVIATDVGMVSEFLPAEYIVSVGDVKALSDKMLWANTHLDEWRSMMEPVWKYAHENLTLDAVIKKTESVYLSILTTK
jgi:glycosyltransferase involved in cell wall biosynthesis